MTDEILRNWMWVFETWTFPFEKLPGQGATWQKGGTRFGAPRPAGKPTTRAHAGVDILKVHTTPILAIADGDVVFVQSKFTSSDDHKFDTDAIWVDHGTFIVRYGEIEPGSAIDSSGKRILTSTMPADRKALVLKPIAQVKQGKPLAKVGLAGIPSMLHFELYYGDRDGSLSDQSNTTNFPFISHTFSNRRFKRRSDLLDPTDVVTMMARNSGLLPKPEYRRYEGPLSV